MPSDSLNAHPPAHFRTNEEFDEDLAQWKRDQYQKLTPPRLIEQGAALICFLRWAEPTYCCIPTHKGGASMVEHWIREAKAAADA